MYTYFYFSLEVLDVEEAANNLRSSQEAWDAIEDKTIISKRLANQMGKIIIVTN